MLADSEGIEKRIVERQKYLNYFGVSSAPRKPTSTTRTTPKRVRPVPGGIFTGTETPKHNWVQIYPIRPIPRKRKWEQLTNIELVSKLRIARTLGLTSPMLAPQVTPYERKAKRSQTPLRSIRQSGTRNSAGHASRLSTAWK